jgi:hypothetical protein
MSKIAENPQKSGLADFCFNPLIVVCVTISQAGISVALVT